LIPYCKKYGFDPSSPESLAAAEIQFNQREQEVRQIMSQVRPMLQCSGMNWDKGSNAGYRTSPKDSVSLNREYRGLGVRFERIVNYDVKVDPRWDAKRRTWIAGYRETISEVDPNHGVCFDPKSGRIFQSWQKQDNRRSGRPEIVDTLEINGKPSPEEKAKQSAATRKDKDLAMAKVREYCRANGIANPTEADCLFAISLMRIEIQAKRVETLRKLDSYPQFLRDAAGEIPTYNGDHHNACTTVRHASPVESRLPVTRTTAGPLSDHRIEASSRVQRFNTQGVDDGARLGVALKAPKIVRLTPPLPPADNSTLYVERFHRPIHGFPAPDQYAWAPEGWKPPEK
jgi:hypothetical protein